MRWGSFGRESTRHEAPGPTVRREAPREGPAGPLSLTDPSPRMQGSGRMSEMDAGRDQLSFSEVNLLLLLDTAGVTLTRPDGSVRWALDADDVCDLLQLAVELFADWCGPAINAATVRERAASLLGTTAAVAPGGQHQGSR